MWSDPDCPTVDCRYSSTSSLIACRLAGCVARVEQKMKKRIGLTASIIAATAITIVPWGIKEVRAQDDDGTKKGAIHYELQGIVEDPVAYRRLVKQALEGHMGAYGLILTAKAPYPEHAQAHIDAIVALAQQQKDLYPEGSESEGTKPEIWSQPEAFAAAHNKTDDAATLLKEKHAEGNRHLILNALVRFGESCQGCHAGFQTESD
jgi:cytochrome c556